jgi:predicted RNA-binding Zn-ribbon protein involved in translation (DUF1610 family)
MAGYKYFWKCPSCGTELQLKMRVTQTKRKCPHCGELVTPQEIDRQDAARRRAFAIGDTSHFPFLDLSVPVRSATTLAEH